MFKIACEIQKHVIDQEGSPFINSPVYIVIGVIIYRNRTRMSTYQVIDMVNRCSHIIHHFWVAYHLDNPYKHLNVQCIVHLYTSMDLNIPTSLSSEHVISKNLAHLLMISFSLEFNLSIICSKKHFYYFWFELN